MIKKILILFLIVWGCTSKKSATSLEQSPSDSYVIAEKGSFKLKLSALMVDNAMPTVGENNERHSKVYMIISIEEESGKNIQNAFAITGAVIVNDSKQYNFINLENKDYGADSPHLEAVVRGLDNIPKPDIVTVSLLDIATGKEFHIKSDKINFVVAY